MTTNYIVRTHQKLYINSEINNNTYLLKSFFYFYFVSLFGKTENQQQNIEILRIRSVSAKSEREHTKKGILFSSGLIMYTLAKTETLTYDILFLNTCQFISETSRCGVNAACRTNNVFIV